MPPPPDQDAFDRHVAELNLRLNGEHRDLWVEQGLVILGDVIHEVFGFEAATVAREDEHVIMVPSGDRNIHRAIEEVAISWLPEGTRVVVREREPVFEPEVPREAFNSAVEAINAFASGIQEAGESLSRGIQERNQIESPRARYLTREDVEAHRRQLEAHRIQLERPRPEQRPRDAWYALGERIRLERRVDEAIPRGQAHPGVIARELARDLRADVHVHGDDIRIVTHERDVVPNLGEVVQGVLRGRFPTREFRVTVEKGQVPWPKDERSSAVEEVVPRTRFERVVETE